MTYSVKQLVLTLQGEGRHAGRAAVLCRFSGCNLWSGRAEDRETALCGFCDTDFVGIDGKGGGRFAGPESLAGAARALWRGRGSGTPFVVCTGGEPLLQLNGPLVTAFRRAGFEVAVETNGTIPLSLDLDWVAVSPKAGAPLVLERGDELKLIFPQPGAPPERYEHLAFRHFYLQPMDGPDHERNTAAALAYCLERPRWRLGLQAHKFLGIP